MSYPCCASKELYIMALVEFIAHVSGFRTFPRAARLAIRMHVESSPEQKMLFSVWLLFNQHTMSIIYLAILNRLIMGFYFVYYKVKVK